MGKAIGMGGVFVHFKGKSKDLFDFYGHYLGMDFSAYGSGFLYGQQLMILSFKRDDQEEMPLINLRVDDIKSIISVFKKDGIEILSDISEYDYGLFATFKDPFGNIVELWQANRDQYIKMVEEEIRKYKENPKPMMP
jgi:predicted enzyme related to lactoylglutathione lyase